MTTALSRCEFAADASYAGRLMRRYAAFFAAGPVADLGWGRGFFLEALLDRAIPGIGVDSSDEAIRHATDLGIECVQRDVWTFWAKHGTGARGRLRIAPDRAPGAAGRREDDL